MSTVVLTDERYELTVIEDDTLVISLGTVIKVGVINSFLTHCSISTDGLPLWDGLPWPGGETIPDTASYFVDDNGNRWIDDGNYWAF
jgi:hypothetical protein